MKNLIFALEPALFEVFQNGMTLQNWTILGYLAIQNVSRGRVQGWEVRDFEKTFFALEPSFFEIFQNE